MLDTGFCRVILSRKFNVETNSDNNFCDTPKGTRRPFPVNQVVTVCRKRALCVFHWHPENGITARSPFLTTI